jgi:hypothetical protein
MHRDPLLTALAAEHTALAAVITAIDDDAWRAPIRADGWSPHDIVAHVADGTYGMARMIADELPAPDFSGPVQIAQSLVAIDAFNDARRMTNAALSREKVVSRLASAFAVAERAIRNCPDPSMVRPAGTRQDLAFWAQRIVDHAAGHREELKIED